MRYHVLVATFAVVTLVHLGSRVCAQAPVTSLALSGPSDVLGEAGSTVNFDLTTELSTSGIPGPDGVEGWSIGITGAGCEIVAGTTAGTAGAPVADGGLRQLDGFERTEFTTGVGNAGIISAVVLTTAGDTTLPPSGSSSLFRVTARAPVPNPIVSGGDFSCVPGTATVSLVDGLRGIGQPVQNKVSYRGLDFRPALSYRAVSICPRIREPRFDLEVSAPASVSGPASGTVNYTATAVLDTSENDGADGAEGWSIGLAASGGRIISATNAGTAAAPVPGGLRRPDGFEKTEITTGAGNEGVVSAVALSSGSPVTLPPLGTSQLLKVTVQATVPEPVLSSGAYVCVPGTSTVFFVDGRRGSGQPVQNKVVYQGLAMPANLGSASTSVCPTIANPAYTFQFNAPATVQGAESGGTVEYSTHCQVRSTLNPGPDGAEGWSLSATADGGTIIAATVAGTVADTVANGGLRQTDGFQKTEITTGAGNEGVVSAVVLSSNSNVTLPPVGTQNVLALTIEAPVPVPGTGPDGEEVCVPGVSRLFYVDGFEGSGQPVKNKVGYRGLSVVPTLLDGVTEICPPLVNPLRMRVDVADPPGTADEPGPSSTPWTVLVPTGEATVPVTVDVVLESNLPAREDGARGWSFSLRTPDCFGIASFTTAGTAVEELFDGGLQRTEIVDPADNGGQEGIVSAIALSLSEPVWLPTVGEEILLKVTGNMDSSLVTGPGELSDPCALEINSATTPGLVGTGQPVKTRVTIDTQSRLPAVHGAEITLEGEAVPPGNRFQRGNANNDAMTDISDGVYVLNYLFLGGEEPDCLDAADTNNSNVLDISDGVYILNFLFLGGPEPPTPYPDCGLDPELDSDGITCLTEHTNCTP